MSIRIRVAQATDDDAWDAFARAHRLGSPFHLIAWKACIQESFGYSPYYLVAEEGESIRGVLPLFLVKSWIIGRALISTPFAVYGGVLADSADVQRSEERRVGEECRSRWAPHSQKNRNN